MKGLVYKSTGSWYNVRLDDGSFIECRIRGKMKLAKLKVTNPIAVGDIVELVLDPNNEGTGIILDIDPRTNYVMRKSVHKAKQGSLIAANIDRAVLIVTLNHPKTSLGFIDRFLVTTDSFRIPSTIVFNKSDLLSKQELGAIEYITSIYEPIGVNTLLISALKNKGIDEFKKIIQGQITLMSGHSGTGKSTITNLLIPDLDQKVGEVSESVNKGVHTTTFAQMFEVNASTKIIDTPGIKELGLIGIEDDELSDYFPEMRALLGQCKYNNCMHTHEPKCAVIEALENEEIAESRYLSYLSMLENEDRRW
ncbi:MAG: ribosome small subunit-dependent GTPase A [Cyclobacteriaceae bacterium]|nr:ribosome small subunit-dependent GTPase A [Cyclobacteriaceae bacterium]